MQVTVAIDGGDIHNLTLTSETTIQAFKVQLALQLKVTPLQITLIYNNNELAEPTRSLASYNVIEHDVIAVTILPLNPQPTTSSINRDRENVSSERAHNNPELVRQNILANPQAKRNLEQLYPELAEATNDPEKFKDLFLAYESKRKNDAALKQQEMMKLQQDPFNVEAQRKIEEIIKTENVMKNMELAMEHNPESFSQVHMLYIDTEVNGVKVKAFVDSGAQSTIISAQCAERCGLLRLMDTRFQGIARGVGTAKILGRVHAAPLRVGKSTLPCSFVVMESSVAMLFGLDMLKRYQASIDLMKNALVINEEEIPFLPEHLIPKNELGEQEPTPSASQSISSLPNPPIQQTSTGVNSNLSRASDNQSQVQLKEEAIKDLMDMGNISREQAVALLTQANGDLDLAANILLS